LYEYDPMCPNYVRPPRYIIYYLNLIDFSNDNNIRFNKSFHVVSANFPSRHLPRLSFSTLDNCVVTGHCQSLLSKAKKQLDSPQTLEQKRKEKGSCIKIMKLERAR
jgi:hypothetical protein